MMKYLSSIFLLSLYFIISGCKTQVHISDSKKILVKGGDFVITTYQRIKDRTKPYVFYIEGDGRPFIKRHLISSDPTPSYQMLSVLADMDNRDNIVYVARPCQYTSKELNPKCTIQSGYWTNKRMSQEVVESINSVINKINNGKKFSLVGYSGGGGIAVLIAAINNKVSDITTIAGNLDHQEFTSSNRVTPLQGSLNPIDYAGKIKHIPQLHLSGGMDKVIAPYVARKFIEKSLSKSAKHKIYENVSHNAGWYNVWQDLLRKRPDFEYSKSSN